MRNNDLLDAKQLMRARKLMKREVNGARRHDRSRADFDVRSQLKTLNLANSLMNSEPDASLRLLGSVASRQFIYSSRAIVFGQEQAFNEHGLDPREAACISYFGFHLQHLEYERTISIEPKRTTRFTMHDIPGLLVAPLLSASSIPEPVIGPIGDSLVGFHQLAKNAKRLAIHHVGEDPPLAKTELIGTAAFAASALSLALGYRLPAPVTFSDDPGEQALAAALDYVLGDEEDATFAFQLALDRHGYRVIHSKPTAGMIRSPGFVPYPFEYLILKQIRTCHGLVNPPFEHVLLYPEYERIHNAFTWFDPREHPVMGQFIRLYEDWSGEKFNIAWPPVEIPN